MPVIQNSLGEMVDLATGKVMGRAEGTVTEVPTSPEALRRVGAPEVQESGGNRVTNLVRNLSWGFNAGLFSLPDAAQRAIGKGLGLNEDEVFQFSRFFNRGEQAPKNAGERFARAIGEGGAAGLPITGVLAAFARATPAIKVAEPSAGILKGIANDAISFIQRNPKTALATDVVFGSAYESLRQAVEESVDPNDPYKQVYKDVLPMAAFMGIPAALSYSPTLLGAKYLKNKYKTISEGLPDLEQQVKDELPFPYKLPVIRILPKMMLRRAEEKLSKSLGDVIGTQESQAALRQLEESLSLPQFSQAGFMLDLAERTQDPALIQRKMDMLSRMPPAEAAALRERITENMRKLSSVSDSVAPGASMSVEQALVAAQRDRQAFFDSLVAQRKDMTQAEIEAISERLGPQNLDMLNDELRGALLANMEMSATQRQQILESLGLRAGTGPEGLPLSTREGGKSLFPAVDIEKQAEALINKYQIERPSLRTPLPAPIQLLSNFVRTQKAAREKIESQLTKSLVDQVFDAELFGTGRTFDPELIKVAKNSARQLVGAATERVEGMKRQKGLSMKDLAELRMGRGKGADAEGNVEIAITPGTSIRINPKKILEDAKAGAEEQTAINLNLPEALDYIQAAIRFRSDALARSRTLDSQRILDTSKAVYDDIEKLVLNSVVDQEQYDVLKGTMDSYRKSFEKRLPLLSTRVTRQGALKQDEYLLPNEDLMKRAFSNAENLRQLKAALQDTPEGVSLIERGAMDWLRSQNVVDKNGLVDPRKMQQVLDRNQNIVDELPANIQQRFQNEVTLAENYISRLGQLDQRKVLAQDNELDSILARGARPDADIKSTLALALEDPAKMRKLVDEFGKNPDHLAALRRGVYDLATEGGKQGGLLKSFLDKNEKSLSVLFRDTEHMKSLKALADIQQRITTFAAATGQVPRFETSNEALQRLFGAGVGWITTSAREATRGFTSPTTVGIAMGVRMASSLETRLYDRIFTRALEDPKFAAAVTKISTPEGAARAAAELSKIGIPPSAYVPRAVVGLKAEAVDAANEAARKPQPPVSKPVPSAKQMLRALPPAPPTRGTSYEHTPRLGPLPELPQQGPQTNLLYPALFPNDPISAMLQARTQPGQNPVMPPPGK